MRRARICFWFVILWWYLFLHWREGRWGSGEGMCVLRVRIFFFFVFLLWWGWGDKCEQISNLIYLLRHCTISVSFLLNVILVFTLEIETLLAFIFIGTLSNIMIRVICSTALSSIYDKQCIICGKSSLFVMYDNFLYLLVPSHFLFRPFMEMRI